MVRESTRDRFADRTVLLSLNTEVKFHGRIA